MRAAALFAHPGDMIVSITLTGTLTEFEELRGDLVKSDVPHHRVNSLLSQISEASMKLRSRVVTEDSVLELGAAEKITS